MATKQRDDLAPRRHALVNTHRLYCDAINSVFVCVEQGEDEIVIDVSTLRVERDGAIRARIESVARAAAASETTTSGDGRGDGIVSARGRGVEGDRARCGAAGNVGNVGR